MMRHFSQPPWENPDHIGKDDYVCCDMAYTEKDIKSVEGGMICHQCGCNLLHVFGRSFK